METITVEVGGESWTVPYWRNGPPGHSTDPVAHWSYLWTQYDNRGRPFHYRRHTAPRGVHRCGICGRWVIRGLGNWWAQHRRLTRDGVPRA